MEQGQVGYRPRCRGAGAQRDARRARTGWQGRHHSARSACVVYMHSVCSAPGAAARHVPTHFKRQMEEPSHRSRTLISPCANAFSMSVRSGRSMPAWWMPRPGDHRTRVVGCGVTGDRTQAASSAPFACLQLAAETSRRGVPPRTTSAWCTPSTLLHPQLPRSCFGPPPPVATARPAPSLAARPGSGAAPSLDPPHLRQTAPLSPCCGSS